MNSKTKKTKAANATFSDEDRAYEARVDEILAFVRKQRGSAQASRQPSESGLQATVH